MKRRQFITLLGGAAAWPLAARAQQQQPTMPVIGFLALGSPGGTAQRVAGFLKGLREIGYIGGQNVAIEYRWAEGQFDRLPALAADLARRQVAAILAIGPPSVRALKAQTTTIPIVFAMGEDPVKEGLVVSLNRPSGNVTGVSDFSNQLFAKRLQLLHDFVPTAALLALLVNPKNPNAGPDARETQAAADTLGRQLQVLTASTDRDLETAFDGMVQRHIGGLIVGADALFIGRPEKLPMLAAHNGVPVIFDRREFPAAGGLMSYGTDTADAYRHCGNYVGRILKGEKPANLPVLQSTKFELIINLKTAKTLGLTLPPGLLAIADEVIE
jgi:putative tryptophan/tyrosine transport system substrate-binding protein